MHVFKEYESVGYLDFRNRETVRRRSRNTLFLRYSRKGKRIARSLSKLSKSRERQQERIPSYVCSSALEYYSELTGSPAVAVETIEESEIETREEFQEVYEELRAIPLEFLQSEVGEQERNKKKLAAKKTG